MTAQQESFDPGAKQCFKCGGQFPLTNFYKHPAMADGYLNKCKECAKRDVRVNYKKNREYYQEYDRQRYETDPSRKQALEEYRKSERGKKVFAKLKKEWQERNPEKRQAHVILGNAVRDGKVEKSDSCTVCSKTGCRIEGHHHDYSLPLDVTWMCRQCHSDLHSQ